VSNYRANSRKKDLLTKLSYVTRSKSLGFPTSRIASEYLKSVTGLLYSSIYGSVDPSCYRNMQPTSNRCFSMRGQGTLPRENIVSSDTMFAKLVYTPVHANSSAQFLNKFFGSSVESPRNILASSLGFTKGVCRLWRWPKGTKIMCCPLRALRDSDL